MIASMLAPDRTRSIIPSRCAREAAAIEFIYKNVGDRYALLLGLEASRCEMSVMLIFYFPPSSVARNIHTESPSNLSSEFSGW